MPDQPRQDGSQDAGVSSYRSAAAKAEARAAQIREAVEELLEDIRNLQGRWQQEGRPSARGSLSSRDERALWSFDRDNGRIVFDFAVITPQEAENMLTALPRLFPGLVLRVTSNAWQGVMQFRSDHLGGITSRLQERVSEMERRQEAILKSLPQGGGAAASHLRKAMEQQPVLVTAELDWPTLELDLSTLPVSIYLADADIHQQVEAAVEDLLARAP